MFPSFFILILAFPWLLISHIRFTKWTPAFSLGGSVNQLNGQAEPHVIMGCVLHLFKIQVSLTEQSCLIHIFFVSWIKDFFPPPSCWRLWEGYTTHSRAQNFWLAPSGAGAGGSGGEAEQHPGGDGRPCRGFVVVCPAAGIMPSFLGQGKGWRACRGRGRPVVCRGFTPGRLCCHPLEKIFVCEHFPSHSSVTTPVIPAVPCVSRAGVTQVPVGSSFGVLLLFPLL